MPMTQAWLKVQIAVLSIERDKAKVAVNRAKDALESSQKETDAAHERLAEAFETLDRLDDCIVGLKDEYDRMNVLEQEAENQAVELAEEMLPENFEGLCPRK